MVSWRIWRGNEEPVSRGCEAGFFGTQGKEGKALNIRGQISPADWVWPCWRYN